MTHFLINEALWKTLTERIKTARHVDAAIAYFGRNGATLLRLRRGDRLVVDMSTPTVRAGGTDPYEVEKLIRRGVQVFTRRNLHAKIVIADNSVVSGSANVSKRSRQVLDEAAILTSEPVAVRRARGFVDRISTEPVRPEYLEKCKRLYRPSRGLGLLGPREESRAPHAKLWLVRLGEGYIPESELSQYERSEKRAEKLVRNRMRFTTTDFHWSHKPRMADVLEMGDWIIQILKRGDRNYVYPPGQLLLIDSYPRGAGRRRWVFRLEVPKRGQVVPWAKFQRAARLKQPRTQPIGDLQAADALLGLWTPSGRLSSRSIV